VSVLLFVSRFVKYGISSLRSSLHPCDGSRIGDWCLAFCRIFSLLSGQNSPFCIESISQATCLTIRDLTLCRYWRLTTEDYTVSIFSIPTETGGVFCIRCTSHELQWQPSNPKHVWFNVYMLLFEFNWITKLTFVFAYSIDSWWLLCFGMAYLANENFWFKFAYIFCLKCTLQELIFFKTKRKPKDVLMTEWSFWYW